MTDAITPPPVRLLIARHGETVFNAAGRIQGDHVHTPLTATGCAQAVAMGEGLARWCDTAGVNGADFALVASDTGRALQTLALVAEPIGADWHRATTDPLLREIEMGEWGGRYYADLFAEVGVFLEETDRLFTMQAPGGEGYADVAARCRQWLTEQSFDRDMVVISHGMTSRILRGLLTGAPDHPVHGVPIAPGLAQGSMVLVENGAETVVVDGAGTGEVA